MFGALKSMIASGISARLRIIRSVLSGNKRFLAHLVAVALAVSAMGGATYFFVEESERSHLVGRELPISGETVYSDIQADLARAVQAARGMLVNDFLIDWIESGEKNPNLIARYLRSVAEKNDLQQSFIVSAKSGKAYSSTEEIGVDPDAMLANHRDAITSYRLDQRFQSASDEQASNDSLLLSYRLSDSYGADVGVVGVRVILDDVYDTIDRFTSQHNFKVILADASGRIVKISVGGQRESGEDGLTVGSVLPIGEALANEDRASETILLRSPKGERIYANARFVPEIRWYLLVAKENEPNLEIAARIMIAGAAVFVVVLILSWAHQEICLRQRTGYLQAKSQSLAAMSHDLKHLIQAHNGLLCVCCEAKRSKHAFDKLSELKALSNEIYALGEKFLSFYRLDLGVCRPNFTATNLSNTLYQLREEALPLISNTKTSINVIAPENCWVHTDRILVKLILRNFISNAIKYAANGDIDVQLEPHSKQFLRVRVVDNGPGLDQETMKEVFNEFTRGANTDGISGDGLGLYLAAYYAKKIGCKVGFDDAYQAGTCFWLDIPRATGSQIANAVATSNIASSLLLNLEAPLKDLRVLVVSEDPDLITMIKAWGANVTMAAALQECAERYQSHQDLAVIDLRLEDTLGKAISQGRMPTKMPMVCIVSVMPENTTKGGDLLLSAMQIHVEPIRPARLKQQLIHLAAKIRTNNAVPEPSIRQTPLFTKAGAESPNA